MEVTVAERRELSCVTSQTRHRSWRRGLEPTCRASLASSREDLGFLTEGAACFDWMRKCKGAGKNIRGIYRIPSEIDLK